MSDDIKLILNSCADEILQCDFELQSHEKYSVDIFKNGKKYELLLCHASEEAVEQ